MSNIEIILNSEKSSFSLDQLPNSLGSLKIILFNLFDFPETVVFEDMKLFFLDEDSDKNSLKTEDDFDAFKNENKHIILIEIEQTKLVKKKISGEFLPMWIPEIDSSDDLKKLEPRIKEIVIKHLQNMLPSLAEKILKFNQTSNPKKNLETCEKGIQTEEVLVEKKPQKLYEEFKEIPENLNQIPSKSHNYPDKSLSQKKELHKFDISEVHFLQKNITIKQENIDVSISVINVCNFPSEKNKYAIKIPERFFLKSSPLVLNEFQENETKKLLFSFKNPGSDGRFGGFFELYNLEDGKVIKNFPFEFVVKEFEEEVLDPKIKEKIKVLKEILDLDENKYGRVLDYLKKNESISVDDFVDLYYNGNF